MTGFGRHTNDIGSVYYDEKHYFWRGFDKFLIGFWALVIIKNSHIEVRDEN